MVCSYSTVMNKRNTVAALLALLVAGCGASQESAPDLTIESQGATSYPDSPDEPRLRNLRQLTHGGENAEAYFSADGQRLIFQSTREGISACDQIFTMNVDGTDLRRVSTGEGRTTCGYFFPSGDRIVYSWEVRPPKRTLAPGESVTVNEAVTDVPRAARFAEIGWKPE